MRRGQAILMAASVVLLAAACDATLPAPGGAAPPGPEQVPGTVSVVDATGLDTPGDDLVDVTDVDLDDLDTTTADATDVSDAGDGEDAPDTRDVNDGDTSGCAHFDCRWTHRARISLDNAGRAALADFPVPVVLPSGFADGHIDADGLGLRFVDSDHLTGLDHEIEAWDPAGVSVIWVRVPQIDADSSADHIWLYLGGPASATEGFEPVATRVWQPTFLGVWHLHDDTRDSTQHGLHAVPEVDEMRHVDAVAGSGWSFAGDSDHALRVADSPVLDRPASELTVSLWFRRHPGVGDDSYRVFLSRQTVDPSGANVGHEHIGLMLQDGRYRPVVETDTARAAMQLSAEATPDTWIHHVVTWDSMTVTALENGSVVDTIPLDGMLRPDSTPLILGGNINQVDGDIGEVPFADLDEVRLSERARPLDWTLAEEAAMRGEMVKLGTLEPAP